MTLIPEIFMSEQPEMKSSQNEILSNCDLKLKDEATSCQMPDIERSSTYLLYDSKYLQSVSLSET